VWSTGRRHHLPLPRLPAPAPTGLTAELLEAAVRRAAASVTVPCPTVDDDQVVILTARWGEQLDVRRIDGDGDGGELSAEQVAGYVAKYATKSTEALGVTLDGRVSAEDLDVPAHVAELVRACWELGARPGLARLRLRAWAHMLGFGGHFASKSRRYSTTLGALRRAGWPTRSAGVVAARCRWMPGAGRRTTRRPSSSPPGATWARVTSRPGRRGWPPRRLLALVSSDASPKRNYEPQRSLHEHGPEGAGPQDG
jgi:hypothetical protein